MNKSFGQLQVGLSKISITPQIETIDTTNSGTFETNEGYYFNDLNGNGKHDKYWLAGFPWVREANAVNDSLWARAIVWDNGNKRVCLVTLDIIAIFYEDVKSIRELAVESELNIDHIIIAATHTHSAPDLLGMNGPQKNISGINKDYLSFVKHQTICSIKEACDNLKPSVMKVSQIHIDNPDLIIDNRPPYIFDSTLNIIQICDPLDENPIGMFMNWGNHPHCFGDDSITSDFYHYWREGVETGIVYNEKVRKEGVGGIAICVNGAMGGHIVYGKKVYDPWLKKEFRNGSGKARAVGYRMADIVLDHIKDEDKWERIEDPSITVQSSVFGIEVQNYGFVKLEEMGILNKEDYYIDERPYVNTEIDILTIGPVWFLTIPGEIFPEIVNGGVESPEGGDYPGKPLETTPLRQLMKGKYNFIIGLANDQVGYIIPKTQWDNVPPYTYNLEKRPSHEEDASIGPDASSTIYFEIKKLIDDINFTLSK